MDGSKVFNNLIWRFMERMGSQGITFVVSIILARLLDPAVYGTIALVNVFIIILQVFVDSGFGNALIQKKDADDIDFSTVFYFNLVVCGVLYLLMFFCAPIIARFYNEPTLTPVIRVLSLTLIVSGVKNVQQAFVSKKMIFKKFFYATLFATIGSAIVGIIFAYKGFGVWALVAQNLFLNVISTVTLWFIVKWRPKLLFSFARLKGLFSFGWKLLVSSLIDTVYNNIRQLIIGKLYTSEDLAFYNKGKHFPNLAITNVNASIDSVLFPAMSESQDDKHAVKLMTRRAIQISSFVVCPIMMGIAMCAEPLIALLLTEKWLPCVPYLRVFCFTYALYPIHTANLNAIKALGRSDMYLKLEIVKKIIGMAVLVAVMWHSPLMMAYSLIFTSIITSVVNAYPNIKLLNYGYFEQIKDILPSIIMSVVMGVAVYLVQFLNLGNILTLLLQIIVGVVLYITLSILTKNDIFYYLLKKILMKVKSRTK